VVFIGVDEVQALLDRQVTVDIIDVRTRSEYQQLHIAGARSIPLRSLPERTKEIPKDRLVVLY